MMHSFGRILAVLVALMIGAGPACACPGRMDATMDRPISAPAPSSVPVSAEHACCRRMQETLIPGQSIRVQPGLARPAGALPAPPQTPCAHCPLMSAAHAVADQSAVTPAPPSFHWIAWSALPPVPALLHLEGSALRSADESPPPPGRNRLHLLCLLML